MAKVIERGDISLHKADALLFGDPEDLSTDALKALDDRYGRDAEGNSLLKSYHAYLNNPAVWTDKDESWVPGMIFPIPLGPAQDDMVIFCCVKHPEKTPQYPDIRDCIRKIVSKIEEKKLTIKHVASPVLGSGHGNIRLVILEPIMRSAAGRNALIDIYSEFVAGRVPT